MNRRGELHGTQMSRGALRCRIGLRTIAFANKVLELSSAKTDIDINGFWLRQKLNVCYFSIGVKPM